MKNILLVSLITYVTLMIPSTVNAQTTATATAVVDGVYQKQRLAKDIAETKKTLLGQLTEYDEVDRRYDISLNQYQNLQTLEALQDTIDLGKTTMDLRAQVLSTYLRLLQLQLIDVEGAELSLKELALEKIEKDRNDLQASRAKIQAVKDRESFNEVANDFIILGDRTKQTSGLANSLLTLGKLQTVYDQASIMAQKIGAEVDDIESALLKSRQESSLKEINRLKEGVNEELNQLWTKLQQRKRIAEEGDGESYYNFNKYLGTHVNSIYSELSQLITYLEEILEDVESAEKK